MDQAIHWTPQIARTDIDNEFKGNQTVIGNLHIQGSVTIDGSGSIVRTEDLSTGADLIVLRDSAVNGLTSSGYCGLLANKYDGTNSGALVYDETGTARVGNLEISKVEIFSLDNPGDTEHFSGNYYTDEQCTTPYNPGTVSSPNWYTVIGTIEVEISGVPTTVYESFHQIITSDNTVPLLGRDEEDNLVAGQILIWDATNKIAKSGTLTVTDANPSATDLVGTITLGSTSYDLHIPHATAPTIVSGAVTQAGVAGVAQLPVVENVYTGVGQVIARISVDGANPIEIKSPNASAVSVVGDTSNTDMYPVFFSAQTGLLTTLYTNTNLKFHPSTGEVTATSFNATSSRSKKKCIKEIKRKDFARNLIDNTKFVTFKFKTDPKDAPIRVGFIAEDTDIILTRDGEHLDLYTCLGTSMRAIQELSSDLKLIKQENKSMKAIIKDIAKRLDKLENR